MKIKIYHMFLHCVDRLCLSAFLLAFCAQAAVGETNFLINTSFRGDGMGGALNWNLSKPLEGSIERRPGQGPGGADALKLSFNKVKNRLTQGSVTLIPGERYRFGVWVKTRNLPKDHDFHVLVYNYAWLKEMQTPLFPCDTAGEWREIVWEGTFIESRQPSFGYTIWGSCSDPSAEVLVAKPFVEPLSPRARVESASVAPAKPMVARIVPIDPLLARVDNAEGRIIFYYPGDFSSSASETLLEATVDGQGVPSVAFSEDHTARLKLGRQGEGDHALSVCVRDRRSGRVLARNDYPICVIRPDEKGPSGKKLNNFVTELYKAPAKDGAAKFFNPREGWVYIGFDRVLSQATVALDDTAFPVVRHRPDELTETMRYLPCGWHTLHVAGTTGSDATLSVRTLKRIVYLPTSFDPRPSDWSAYSYRFDFCKRYAFRFFNTDSNYSRETYGWPHDAREAYMRERGLDTQVLVCFPKKEEQDNPDAWIARWRENPALCAGMSFQMDEMAMSHPRAVRIGLSEACWRFAGTTQQANAFVCDPYQNVFVDRATQTTLISSVVNSGRGHGMIQPEVYSAAIADEREAYKWEDYMLGYVKSMESFVPASHEKLLWYFATFLSPGGWNDWPCPEADIRVLYAHFIHRLATDPAFEGTIGGISAAFMDKHVDEDVTRWLCKIMRYYCVEGGTDYLPEKYGFPYLPGIVRDGDLTKGFAEWTARPAEKGSLTAATRKGLGTGDQHRMKVPEGTGDTHARFVRSAKGPNLLSQRLTGLEPGRLYNLMYLTEDEDDLDKPGSVPQAFGCRATFDGAAEVTELASVRHVPEHVTQPTASKTLVRLVFRAERPDVTLTFSDWQSDAAPGAPIGRKTLLNYIHARKYYLENEEELQWLVDTTRRLKSCK